jgi:uncharacterized surface protein with fasciclin (FAS1) repeats
MKLFKIATVLAVAAAAGVYSFTPATAFAGDCSGSKCESGKTTATAYGEGKKEKADIVDTAVAAGSFKTLAAALKAADLVDVLKGDGPFTVFAPTDEAFAKLPKETLEHLLKPENKAELAAILTYHVVAGKVTAEQVVKLSEATTVNGAKVAITVTDGKVVLNGNSTVTKTDVYAKNGVIHVIDTVILPPAK